MTKWPISRWAQGWIAVAVAAIFSYAVFKVLEQIFFDQAVKEAPYDGQDGLSAFMGALDFSIPVFFVVLFGAYILQRVLTRRNREPTMDQL